MADSLIGSVIPRELVSEGLADRLYRLFVRHYREVRREMFDRDLEEKEWVLLLRDMKGDVRGFTTMMLYDIPFQGRRIRAVFSGNTVIERESWGNQELVRTWCRFMADRKCEEPTVPLYWFLISSGYRTYLFLPFFYQKFYPRWDNSTPPFEKALIDMLGRMKYPREYRDGVVRVSNPRECLDPRLAVPSERKLRNPHVRFFLEQNPGYLRGDELVCITEFSLDNNLRTARGILLERTGSEFSSPESVSAC